MSTVTVTLSNDAWLTDVANPAQSVTASFPERTQTPTLAGEVRFYAGGRARVITTRNDTRTYPLVLQWLSDADLDRLIGWRGRVLLLRDNAGRRVFGTFLAATVEDIWQSGGTRHTATVTFTAVSWSEVV